MLEDTNAQSAPGDTIIDVCIGCFVGRSGSPLRAGDDNILRGIEAWVQRREAALIVEPFLRGAIGRFIVHQAPVRQDDAVADLIHGAVPAREATKPVQDSMLSGPLLL